MKKSIPVAGLGALLLAGGAVGCGSEQSPEMTPTAAVAKAAKNTEEITSIRFRMNGTSPESGKVKGEASMRLKPTIAMSMKVSATGQAATAGEAEIRLVDKAMYIGGGAEMAKEMDGKSWMKFDLSGSEAGKELDQQGPASQARQDPAAESTFLTGAKNVKKVGTEKIDGVETTHYSGTATLAELRESLKKEDAKTRERREKSLKQYEEMGVDKLSMDTWIDGDDRTKQFRLQGEADGGPLDMTITFVDYNKPVEIKAPPAKDVADLADLFKGLDAS